MYRFLLVSTLILGASCLNQEDTQLKRLWPRWQNGFSSPGRDPPEDRTPQVTWRLTATANRLFAHRLYSNIARHEREGNILISPFLVSTGLSMTLLGAEGETEEELMKALGYRDIGQKRRGEEYTKDDVPRLYRSILQQLKLGANKGRYMLRVANRLYGDVSQTFEPDFLDDTENYFGARLAQVDFANNPELARDEINEWVRNRTENTIPEAVPPGTVTSATLLTLVSTAVFKGLWKEQFDPAQTYSGSFTRADGADVPTDFMHGDFRMKYRYSFKLQSHILIIPYKSAGSKHFVEMELYLPFENRFLARVEQMKEDDIHQELRGTQPSSIELHLPKFRIEYSTDLRDTLQRFGINTLFGNADLSGMNGQHNLNIASITHKTFLQVDEKGTTAGASVVQTMNKSVTRHVVLRFDHPFVAIIREKYTNSILFMGRIANPTQ